MSNHINLRSSLFRLMFVLCLLFGFLVVPAKAAEATYRGEKAIEVTTATAAKAIDEVPLYFQTDYPKVPYGNGTLETSGCGITCLSMVATYLTDTEILPDELAEEFGSRRDSNVGRMEYASETLGLTYEKEFSWDNVVKALKDGKIAIVLVNERTKFTKSQHLIVLTGMTEDDKIQVNDPYERNYKKLKSCFEEGFEESAIKSGFQGAWIYDKQTMSSDNKEN